MAVRSWLTELLTHPAQRELVESHLIAAADVTMQMPSEVADIGRPSGQRKAPADATPTYGPSARLDIEAEVGFVVGTPSRRGTPVRTDAFRDHVFGVCLLNDWSARDIQAWEYVPLGPFLGKSFGTSVSPWVVPLDALEKARVTGPSQHPDVLPYLRGGEAHLTVNGASLRTGDLFASGTVSAADRQQRGSFLELSWNGSEPVTLGDGSTRTFLEYGDMVSISAWAPAAHGVRLGFGDVTGRILPALPALPG